MQKPKNYDWKDSNLALFGSDLEKNVKKASSQGEKAWEAVKNLKTSKLFVWRIEKFKVKEWPKEEYGKFYSGDSYIVLNAYKPKGTDEMLYDVHFWIGKKSTQDEYGTAAYKTVELDNFLDDKPVQHREVQGNESDMFKDYFPVITILKGGCDSGFRQVKPQEYKPRLLHFHGHKRLVEVVEVKFTKHALVNSDVFILDLGTTAYQWNGSTANKDEKVKAAQYLQHLEGERMGRCQTETVDETDITQGHKFYQALPDKPYDKDAKEKKAKCDENFKKSMFRLSDSSGKMTFSLVSEGSAPKAMIEESDVYVIDNGRQVFVYVGSGASDEEKNNAMVYAHNYLQQTLHPLVPVVCLRSGQKNDEFVKTVD